MPENTDDDGFAPEQWTYAGTAQGAKAAKVAIWYDGDRTRLAYKARDTARLVVGGLYEVEVHRHDGTITARTGTARYTGQHPDDAWRARLEAAAYAETRDLAAAALERKAKTWTYLDEALAPVVAAAAGMNYAQRDALIALVTRKIYRASEKDRDAGWEITSRIAARRQAGEET